MQLMIQCYHFSFAGSGEEHPGAREERLLGDVLVQEELRATLARVRCVHQPRLQTQLQGKYPRIHTECEYVLLVTGMCKLSVQSI